MTLRVHNTLTGQLEDFRPLRPPKVGMYVCGVTVYDRSHIGHARALVCFDVIYRYLRFSGYEVTFVRNFTDVDDKIIKRGLERGLTAQEVSEANIASFREDMQVLGCAAPDVEPKATEHIAEMIALIRELEAKGLAYASNGDVYFAVDKLPSYGQLSGRRLEDMQAGARIEVDEQKRHPMDFALWKASKPGEPFWDSPWGPGRPGWHIECSAMASKYLGQPFDIHGGGNDLIFPHHENEIAQSEGAKGCQLARYWLHNGMVTLGTEKMSKSLGNVWTVADAAAQVGGEALRLLVLGTHYRGPLDFQPDRLLETKRTLDRVYDSLARIDEALAAHPVAPDAAVREACLDDFRAGMDDDFNTARGLATLFDAVRALNRHADAGEWPQAAGARAAIAAMAGVLGVAGQDPRAWVARGKARGLEDRALSPAAIEALIADRAAARRAKDFRRADAIRDELKAKGVVLEDGPQGTTWKIE
ncbi:cysteine--tRNA ligase [bacterium]|nr:cysteine--tRNA ligase [bacterium]